jgi:hypothetical protein
MDDIVRQAIAKWPNVPHCYGWLGLDARGDWYLRDERTQAAGPFPDVKGSRLQHQRLREFIERNYAHDDAGCWFFQNGQQRVYVELEAAPWVWRLAGADTPDGMPAIRSHTGLAARFESAWLDEADRLFLATDLGLGLVHTLDMETAADAIEAGACAPRSTRLEDLVERYHYRLSPAHDRATERGQAPSAQLP